MKFSVLMSVYRLENPDFLKTSIESIINQTVIPSEIVIIKDGRLTRELDSIIDEFYEKYPHLFNIITLNENKGLGIALKIGVQNCKNDLIARMDTDDICKIDRFEKQYKFLIENPDIDMVGSYIEEFEENSENIISTRKVPINNEDIIYFAKKRNPFNHMTVMYRKHSVLEAGNYKEFLWNEDYYLWVRMIKNGAKFHNIPESLVKARIGADMFKRRGGFRYAIQDIKLQNTYKSMNFIDKKEFIINIFYRICIRMVPNSLRRKIYLKILRN